MPEILATLHDEEGATEAFYGMSLSHGGCTDPYKRACKLAHKQGGHNKFLESMILWIEIDAPRYWWQQFDTYRLATKQSASTMHTLHNEQVSEATVSYGIGPPIPWRYRVMARAWFHFLSTVNRTGKHSAYVKAMLPEGWMQKRLVCLSYKTLQNMYHQRKHHRLGEWGVFLHQILEQVHYPEFIRPTAKVKETIDGNLSD